MDRDITTVGDTVNLTLTFQSDSQNFQPSPPRAPNVPGLRFQSAGVRRFLNLENGSFSASFSFNYVVFPDRVGDFTIPAITAQVGGQQVSSQPLQLKVQKAIDLNQGGQTPPAFLKLIVSKNEIYVGEIVPVEIRLYYQDANAPNVPQLPAEGFNISVSNRPEQTQANINGNYYHVDIFRGTLSAIKPGDLKLGPASDDVSILIGYQGDDIFGGRHFASSRPTTLKSEEQTMQVHPLPPNAPATFNGAIGKFNLHLEAAPTTVAVGDPITVKIQISGEGSFDSVSLPPQPAWREFKTYKPSVKTQTSGTLGLQGAKFFEQVVSPENTGVKELPPFEFSFFDPEQKGYRTLSSPAIPLNVHPTDATPQPTIVSANQNPTQDNQPQQKEIVHIKQSIGTISTVYLPLIQRPAFLVAQAFAPMLWIGAIFLRRRKEALANNPKLRRQREVARVVQEGLQQLSEYAAANKSDEFFATLFRLLQEQIGERLDVPAASITEAVVDERLRVNGLSAETANALRELFQSCNQARYAPEHSSEKLASYIPKLENALNELQRWNP